MPQKISPKTTIGSIALMVSDLERSLKFYRDVIGLQVKKVEKDNATLGTLKADLLYLKEKKGARIAPRRSGLYHFGILLPTRFSLANSLKHFVEMRASMTGFADHHVSESIYLTDPDGHGVEVTWDRPRHLWKTFTGTLNLTVDPLDVGELMNELDGQSVDWKGLPQETRIGNIHLHVADLKAAEKFYVDVLGFQVRLRSRGMIFLSASDYHHHIGLSTWIATGALPSTENALRLIGYEIHVPDEEALRNVRKQIVAAGIHLEKIARGWLVFDPSLNPILLRK